MLLPLIAPGARGVNSLLLEGGKFWTHLRRPVLAGVTPRSDWTPGMSQGPSEDKVQLRAATLLIEQTGAGCVDTEGRRLNQGLLRMGGTGRVGGTVKSPARGQASRRCPGRPWGGDRLKYTRPLSLPSPISPGLQGRHHSGGSGK